MIPRYIQKLRDTSVYTSVNEEVRSFFEQEVKSSFQPNI